MEFDFREMAEDDYHGVKTLLSQIATGSLATLSSLADPIVSQVNIGTVVKAGDGEAGISGFGTILNIRQHMQDPGMTAVRSILKEFNKKAPKHNKIITDIASEAPQYCTGLVLKERLINFPPELAPNIHKVLIGDVEWSKSDEYEPEDGEKREDYDFEFLLFLSAFEVESTARSVEEGDAEQAPMGHKKKRKMDKKGSKAARVYLHWEDEVFMERSIFSHSWQNSSKPVVVRANRKYHSFNTMFCLRWSDYLELADRLAQAM